MTAERWSQVREALLELIEQSPEERTRTLERIGQTDPALREEAQALLELEPEADRVLERTLRSATGLAQEPDPPGFLGPYRLVRELGHGGMGVVWLAERHDGQFYKSVAIKLLPRLYVSTSLEVRFLRERQILAQLEHPAIARLIDGGVTGEGQPYIVMEYVDGVPLSRWVRDRQVDLNGRLRLFLDVCAAVSYAHQHMIVHRDLKPGNILIDTEGHVKLLDFGLGAILEPAAVHVTQTAAAMLTPAYASPEQARGKPGNAATDVFSLGVILYELLAERWPFGSEGQSADEMLRAVCETEPVPPGRFVRRLARDLDNLVLKALEKEPARRYSSVEALARDVRAYLEGRPVSAHNAGWMYRARKFARRHWLAIGASAVVSVALVTAGIISLREGQLARRRFNDVRRLAHAVIFDLHDAVASVPGTTPARELLVRQGLQYLDSLAAESAGDVDLQEELGEGYMRLAEVQGASGGMANIGDGATARKSLRKAAALLEQAWKSQPANRKFTHQLARAYRLQAVAEESEGAVGTAEELVRRALSVGEADLASHPGDRVAVLDLAASRQSLAGLKQKHGRNQEAVELYRKIIGQYEPLLAADPRDATAAHDVSLARKRIGAILIVLGKNEEALPEYAAALEIDTAMAARYPANTDRQLDPTFAMTDMGLAMQRLGRWEPALAKYREALEIRRRLEASDPRNVRITSSVNSSLGRMARAETNWGNVLAGQAMRREALPHWRAAKDLFAELERRSKLSDDDRELRAQALAQLAPAQR